MSKDNLWFQRTETPEPEPTEPAPDNDTRWKRLMRFDRRITAKHDAFWRRFGKWMEKKHPWILLIITFPYVYAETVYEDVQHGLPQGTSNPTLHRP